MKISHVLDEWTGAEMKCYLQTRPYACSPTQFQRTAYVTNGLQYLPAIYQYSLKDFFLLFGSRVTAASTFTLFINLHFSLFQQQ